MRAGLRRGACAMAMAVVTGIAAPAAAHALLERATPAAGSTVRHPTAVVLSFSEELEPAFCRLQVDDARGHRVDRGDIHVSATDTAVLEVTLPALPAGTYHVSWRVVSIDTHVTEGAFTFEVRP